LEKDLKDKLIEFKNNTEKNINSNLNEINDLDKKSFRENLENSTCNKNSYFHKRNNSEINSINEKNVPISNKNGFNIIPIYNPRNINNSNCLKSNGFSTYRNNNEENEYIFNQNKIFSGTIEEDIPKAISKKKTINNGHRISSNGTNSIDCKYNIETVDKDSPPKFLENNDYENKFNNPKTSISNFEITSIGSLNNYDIEKFNSNKISKSIKNSEKYEKNHINNFSHHSNLNNNTNDNFSEENIINNEVYDFNIGVKKNRIGKRNLPYNYFCNSSLKKDYENHYVYPNENNKGNNLIDYRKNNFDNSLEELINMKSSELYRDNSLYSNLENKYEIGGKYTIDVIDRRKNYEEYNFNLNNSNISFDRYERNPIKKF